MPLAQTRTRPCEASARLSAKLSPSTFAVGAHPAHGAREVQCGGCSCASRRMIIVARERCQVKRSVEGFRAVQGSWNRFPDNWMQRGLANTTQRSRTKRRAQAHPIQPRVRPVLAEYCHPFEKSDSPPSFLVESWPANPLRKAGHELFTAVLRANDHRFSLPVSQATSSPVGKARQPCSSPECNHGPYAQ